MRMIEQDVPGFVPLVATPEVEQQTASVPPVPEITQVPEDIRSDGLKAGSPGAILVDTVCRPEGATNRDLADAVGSEKPVPTLKRYAKIAGVTIRTKQEGRFMRYFGIRGIGAESVDGEETKEAKIYKIAKSKDRSPSKPKKTTKKAADKDKSVKAVTGKGAQALALALRKNGVSPQELNDAIQWKGAPWKWLFHNSKGTGYCDRMGYRFEVFYKDNKVRYRASKS